MPLELIVEERGAPPRTQVVAADTAFVGRREDCDVVLPYSFVSARHARLQARAGKVFVEDLGSTNGVLVNGEPLAPLAPRALAPGDVVQIEKIAIRARVAETPGRAADPTYHEIRIPAAVGAPPPVPAGPPPATPGPPLPAPAATIPPTPRPASAVVGERADLPGTVPLRRPSLPEALQATREMGRPRPPASRSSLASRVAAAREGAGRLPGASRYLLLSLVFRGLGVVAVLGGLALLLLVLLA